MNQALTSCIVTAVSLLAGQIAAADTKGDDGEIEELVVRPVAPGDGSSILSSTRAFVPPGSFTDLLQSTPAISLVGQGGRLQTFAIRGLGQERIRVMLNGAPLRALRRAGVSASFLPPEWMQVFASPQSAPVSQGSGAVGGSVIASPRQNLPDRLSVSYEGPGNYRSLSAGGNSGNYYAGIIHQRRNDQDAPDGTRLNTSFEQTSFNIQRTAETQSTLHNTTLLFSEGQDIGKSNSDFPVRVTSYPTERHLFASHEMENESLGRLTGWLHSQKLKTKTLREGARSDVDTSVLDYGFRFEKDALTTTDHQLHWGLDLFGRDDFETKENDASTLRDGSELELGAYFDGEQMLGNWSLGYGLRMLHGRSSADDQPDFDTTELLGHASIRWQSDPRFSWRFTTHRATTLPTVSQLFFTGITGRGEVVGNDSLDAEDAWIYEYRAESSLRKMSFSLSAFFMDIDSFINKVSVTEDLDTFINADGGEVYGFTGELAVDLNPVRLEAGFNTLRGELDNGEAMRDIPASQAMLRARWSLTSGVAAIEIAQRFRSDRVTDDNRKEDARSLVNASYQHDFNDRLKLTIFGRNLLDELYFVSGDDKSTFGSERSLGISVDIYL